MSKLICFTRWSQQATKRTHLKLRKNVLCFMPRTFCTTLVFIPKYFRDTIRLHQSFLRLTTHTNEFLLWRRSTFLMALTRKWGTRQICIFISTFPCLYGGSFSVTQKPSVNNRSKKRDRYRNFIIHTSSVQVYHYTPLWTARHNEPHLSNCSFSVGQRHR